MEPILSGLIDGWVAKLAAPRKTKAPRYQILCDAIRDDVLDGRLQPGTKLPASRELSKALGISRNTVVSAFDLLAAEGVVDGKVGDGTRIAAKLPGDTPLVGNGPSRAEDARQVGYFATGPTGLALYSPGVPDLTLFPFDIWARLSGRVWRHDAATLALARDERGHLPLRQEIATHLGPARGVVADSDDVIVVSGAQQALYLICRTLLGPGDRVGIENPCFEGLPAILRAQGTQAVSLPTDENGLIVDALEDLKDPPKLVVVTPSRVYPTGAGLSLTRRLALLDWAQRADAWIIEDDYDSDFRYDGPPLSSLHGLDKSARTIYIGSFSKVLFPSIRLGYVIPPADMTGPLVDVRRAADGWPATAPQSVLAAFFAEGHYHSHLKRTRRAYGARRRALLDALEPALQGRGTIYPADGGMHVCVRFHDPIDDAAMETRLKVGGLGGEALSAQFHLEPKQTGVILGFAAHGAKPLVAGVEQLVEVIWPDGTP